MRREAVSRKLLRLLEQQCRPVSGSADHGRGSPAGPGYDRGRFCRGKFYRPEQCGKGSSALSEGLGQLSAQTETAGEQYLAGVDNGMEQLKSGIGHTGWRQSVSAEGRC